MDGWGRPLNFSVNHDKVHYWREDGVPICRRGSTGYLGDKISASNVKITEVCPECFNIMFGARIP